MARINIEDSLYQDVRFVELTHKCNGSLEQALGCIVRAWSVAQIYWKNGKRPIPKTEFFKRKLSPYLIECGLAEYVDNDFIYMRGSEEQFSWLIQKQNAGKIGGKASHSKSLKKKSSVAKHSLNAVKPLTPSPSLPLTLAHTQNTIRDVDASRQVSSDTVIKSPVGYFIYEYRKAFQKRYGEKASPDLRGKTQGQIKRFLKEVPLERAVALIQVYLQIDDKWFITKSHDFTTFDCNLSKIGVALDQGFSDSNKLKDYWADFLAEEKTKKIKGDV